MKSVLDASVFFSAYPIEGDIYTTPSVCDELVDIRAKGTFEKLSAAGLRVVSPDPHYRQKVIVASDLSRDKCVLSETDLDLLAVALEMEATLITDDFAIQNVAIGLGVTTRPISQRRAKRVQWKYRCTGCGRYWDHDGECRVCGAVIKRKLK